MLGKTSGFASLVKKEVPHIIATHCIMHRHALASKTLSSTSREISITSKKIVNFVRTPVLNHRNSKCFVKKWVRNMKFFCIIQKSAGFRKVKF